MKYKEKFYVIEIKIVIIFEISLDLKKIKFEIKKSRLGFNTLFIIRFKLTNVDEIYEICREINYIIYDYKIITSFKSFKKIRFFLLKDKFFIL